MSPIMNHDIQTDITARRNEFRDAIRCVLMMYYCNINVLLGLLISVSIVYAKIIYVLG